MTGSVLVVGAGLAAAQVVSGLTASGWRGSITVVGDEPRPPYHRPPLSKDYLRGVTRSDQLELRAQDFYDERGVRLVLGDPVVDLGLRADGSGFARTESRRKVEYDRLVLCTGAEPRRLPMFDNLSGVHYLRTADDADRLRTELIPGARLVVLGAGFVGLEVAATGRAFGCHVTVIESGDRVLARVVGPTVADHVSAHHRGHGIAVRTGVTATDARSVGGRVGGVVLSDGTIIGADVVVVGIGAEPRAGLASEAGLECAGGIVVDADGVASDGVTLAVGDCAVARGGSRLESVDNATQGAAIAVASLLGQSRPDRIPPWFWSDQGELKLQMVGIPTANDTCVVRRSPDGTKLACVYYRDGSVAAAHVVNAPADFVALRKAVAAGLALDPALVADPATRLSRLVAVVPA